MMVVFSKFYPLPPPPPKKKEEKKKKKEQNHEEELGGRRPKNKKTKKALRTDEGAKLSANQNRTTKKRTQRARV